MLIGAVLNTNNIGVLYRLLRKRSPPGSPDMEGTLSKQSSGPDRVTRPDLDGFNRGSHGHPSCRGDRSTSGDLHEPQSDACN